MKIVEMIVVLGAVLIVVGCQKKTEHTESTLVSVTTTHDLMANQTAHPAAKSVTGINVTSARLVLPAVKGNPAAAYFTVTNQENVPISLVGIEIHGATSAQMHETVGSEMKALGSVKIPAKGFVTFAPGGKHVMVFGLAPNLQAGKAIQMTVEVSIPGVDPDLGLNAPLRVEAAGASDASNTPDDMAGMKM